MVLTIGSEGERTGDVGRAIEDEGHAAGDGAGDALEEHRGDAYLFYGVGTHVTLEAIKVERVLAAVGGEAAGGYSDDGCHLGAVVGIGVGDYHSPVDINFGEVQGTAVRAQSDIGIVAGDGELCGGVGYTANFCSFLGIVVEVGS